MQHSRFVFLAAPMPGPQQGQLVDGIRWLLVSSNNRPLGRGTAYHEVYAQCRESVLELQANAARIVAQEGTVPASGQWVWRVQLDDVPVALSSRSYLRARECSYNLERFLEALPHAEVADGTRTVRRDRRRAAEPVSAVAEPAVVRLIPPARLTYRLPTRLTPRKRDAG
ncbi:hypothetical protein K7640_08830 [Micromonospora sp. PLK6-60]|uniref:hypothetical protein n=1 Tax=Micromonospora sp. PLK6-60 TaxID=2873383 RepID=UPI001CA79C33|nr:hypothetical protein [Micromonospora sp. PLK6-60]MBY8871944.1 hypothetical protein [Micromonospora sp. PLK6-60]